MRRRICGILLVLLGWISVVYAQDRKEMIILFDTSVSVLPIYEDLATLVVRGVEDSSISSGDSVHLLSFDDAPVYELSHDVGESGDLSALRRYLRVLKPMGLHTDLITALNYLYNFVTQELMVNTRKTILILTDGIHDPSPDSPSYGRDEEYIRNALLEIAAKLNRQGWVIRLLGVPPALDGSTSYLPLLAKELNVEITDYDGGLDDLSGRLARVVRLSHPGELGDVGGTFQLPISLTNYDSLPVSVTLNSISSGGEELLVHSVSADLGSGESAELTPKIHLPSTMEIGSHTLEVSFNFSDGQNVQPSRGRISFYLTEIPKPRSDGRWLYSIIIVAFLLLVGVVLTMLIRRRGASTNRYQAMPSDRELSEEPSSDDEVAVLDEGRVPAGVVGTIPKKYRNTVIMRVDGQNARLAPNILKLIEGGNRTVGGKGSDFYIFLYPFPPNIARISRDEGCYTLTPLVEECFVGLDGSQANCLNRWFTITNQSGRELKIRFERWIPPLVRINRLMHSIERTGWVSLDEDELEDA